MEGTIVKGIGGFYYVKVNDNIYECKARGKFRYNELTPMVGDKVDITVNNDKGVIESIHDRISELVRPTVANVTQAFVIFTLTNPELNLDLINRFLVLCQYNNLKIVICINKIDLIELEGYEAILKMLKETGYEVVFLKAKEGYGIDLLRDNLKNNITVFCGPSGVGKSTLLNKLMGTEVMKTGDISKKQGRGKHTTRHSELVDYEDGFIVDTPGFSSLEIDFISKEDLQYCFPEFEDYLNSCKFTGCLHYKEPECSVKNAVQKNMINKERYDFYVKMLEEVINRRIKYD
jgi:ribosome biogenesis GTPase / thiamine phosphate phosphatase